jgi:MazG family protein
MLNYSQSFERIRDIMNLLREKCPWDKKQTIHTLRQLTIENKFTIGDVINTVCDKLVFRHPHIYSHVKVSNEDDVKQNWEKLKLKAGRKSILAGVPDALPAMVKALRMQEKAKQVGFEWEATEQVKAKINEELDELEEAIASQNQHEIENEFGDVLFSLINYARYLGIDPENALSRTNNKFKSRFEKMELKLTQNGKSLTEYSLTEMDNTWNEIKKNET